MIERRRLYLKTLKEIVWFFVFAVIATILIDTLIGLFLAKYLQHLPKQPIDFTINAVVTAISLVGTIFWIVPKEERLAALQSPKKIGWEVLWGFLFGFVFVSALAFIALALEQVLPSTSESLATQQKYYENVSDLIQFIPVVIAAPIFEELYFRGILLNRFLPHGKFKAVVISSILFGVAHMINAGTVYFFIFGFFLALLALWRKNTWYSTGTHAFNNLFVMLIR